MLRNFLIATSLVLISAAAAAPGRAQPVSLPDAASVDWVLRAPGGEVAVNGVVSFDTAGTGAGSMLYPAPGAVGLLAAIVTHAVIESSLKRKQRLKMQEAADEVLAPYRHTLATFSNRDVELAALSLHPFGDRKKLDASADGAITEWRISSSPHFFLTQDQRAFIVDNAIEIYAPGSDVSAYRTSVRVVSRARYGQDLVALWTDDQGSKLKKEWAYLFAESVDVALHTAARPGASAAFTTVRYAEGGSEKMERAQLLYSECGRLVLRTLRGALMSVPVGPEIAGDSVTGACPAP